MPSPFSVPMTFRGRPGAWPRPGAWLRSAAWLRPAVWLCLAAVTVPVLAARPALAGQWGSARAVPVLQSPRLEEPSLLAFGTVPAMVWISPGEVRRVHAAVPPELPPVQLGLEGPGHDAEVAVTSDDDGRIWVVGSRRHRGHSRLWIQSWSAAGWSAPQPAPRAAEHDHHPAIAAAGGAVWLTWVGEGAGPSDVAARLYAARLHRGGWSEPTAISATPGRPSAPSIALDARHLPSVVWTAGGGAREEVWLTELRSGRTGATSDGASGGGWTSPLRLSANDVPDILPRVAGSGDRTLVVWNRFTGRGYVPVARIRGPEGTWAPAQELSAAPGLYPIPLAAGGDLAIVWRTPRGARREPGRLVASVHDGSGWGERRTVAEAASQGPVGATRRDGRVVLGWLDGAGTMVSMEAVPARGEVPGPERGGLTIPSGERSAPPGDDHGGVGAGRSTAEGSAAATSEQPFPQIYTAFGDSLTRGVIVHPDGSVTLSDYLQTLETSLSPLIADPEVPERGVGGEMTAEGVSRIDGALAATGADAVLAMEGTNDISNLVPAETTAFNLERMMEIARGRGVERYLALVLPRNQDGFEGPMNRRVDALNDMLPDVAEATGSNLVDQHTPLDGRGDLYSDALHPNEEGYEKMAEVWFEAIREETLARTNRGDVNRSGRVDGTDLVRLALAFGSKQGEERYRRSADINRDGIVDGFDLSILGEFFGSTLEE